MDFVRRDPVTFGAIAALVLGAVIALLGAPKRRHGSLIWVAIAVAAAGIAVIALEIWFGLTQSR